MRYRYLGWVGLFLGVLALVAVVLPGIGFATALADDGVRVDDGPVTVSLAAHKTYGVYVNAANNSGYSESCTAVDDRGTELRMRDPGWIISSSDTEMLDLVFDSGTGKVTISCEVPGEQVTVRRAPDNSAMFLGVVIGGILGCAGLALIAMWFGARPSRQPQPSPAA